MHSVASTQRITFGITSTSALFFSYVTNDTITYAPVTVTTPDNLITQNAWQHVAVTIDATTSTTSTINLFVNGVKYSFTGHNLSHFTTLFGYYIYPIMLGSMYNTDPYRGYMSDVRINKAQEIYTDNFTPPTSPLTPTSQNSIDSNVVFLMYNSAIAEDTSSANIWVSVVNKIAQFSPWGSVAYSAETHGGSGVFNGSDSVLTVNNSGGANNISTNNFTIEFWIRPQAYGSLNPILHIGDQFTGGIKLFLANGVMKAEYQIPDSVTSLSIQSSALPSNFWYHVALVREGTGANQTKLYINGKLSATGTLSENVAAANNLYVGALAGSSSYYSGSISDLRIVNGTAVYTNRFTPPTTRLTAISNTTLLLPFNTGIVDQNLSVAGNVNLNNTAQYAFGAGSVYFDGVSDYIVVPNNIFDLGSNDFTIEFWIYPLEYGDITAGGQIFGTTNGAPRGYSINLGENINRFRFLSNTNAIWEETLVVAAGGGPNLGEWTHMAIVRFGRTLTIYKNGVSVASTSCEYREDLYFEGTVATIGRYFDGTNLKNFKGYIDNLRVIKYLAKYTGNFIPFN